MNFLELKRKAILSSMSPALVIVARSKAHSRIISRLLYIPALHIAAEIPMHITTESIGLSLPSVAINSIIDTSINKMTIEASVPSCPALSTNTIFQEILRDNITSTAVALNCKPAGTFLPINDADIVVTIQDVMAIKVRSTVGSALLTANANLQVPNSARTENCISIITEAQESVIRSDNTKLLLSSSKICKCTIEEAFSYLQLTSMKSYGSSKIVFTPIITTDDSISIVQNIPASIELKSNIIVARGALLNDYNSRTLSSMGAQTLEELKWCDITK